MSRRKSRRKSARPARPAGAAFRPAVESLEDRAVPASLVSVSADNINPPNAPVVVLATSDDGNVVLSQSTATNLVPGQVDTPGSNDLFWFDRVTGTRKLVTAEGVPANNLTIQPGTVALGAEVSTPGVKLNAVLSGDGKSVAFVSAANAQLFDPTLNPAADDGGDDVYQWDSTTGKVNLVSRNKGNFALGGFSSVSNPGISTDGQTVAFVSTAVPWSQIDTKYKIGTTSGGDIVQPPGPNLFAAIVGQTPRVVTYSFTTFNVGTGKNDGSFFPLFNDISVDPLGRYISGEGISFAVMSDNTGGESGFVSIFPPTQQTVGKDVYRFTFAGVGLNPSGTLNFDVVSTTTSANTFFTNALGAGGFGTVGDAILARDRSDVIVYTAKVNAGSSIVSGYRNSNSSGFDLYRATFSGTGFNNELVTVQAGTTATGGDGALDSDPGGFIVTPDGRFVTFTSTGSLFVAGLSDRNKAFDIFQRDTLTQTTQAVSVTAANPNRTGLGESRYPSQSTDGLLVGFQSSATDLTNTPDNNNALDVFLRDLQRKTTALVSIVPGNFNSADAKSYDILVAGTSKNGRLYFTSEADNLDRLFQVPLGQDEVYTTVTPILVTNVPRAFGYSGGGGFVALAHLDLAGNVVTDGKFQPFPGYTGDIRVASADVNGDGVLDLIAGAGPGGGPRVVVIDGFNGRTLQDFFAFEPAFTGGVYVAGVDVDNDGAAELVIGAGEGGAPRVRVLRASNVRSVVADGFAYEPDARTGVRVAGGDFDGDGKNDLVVSAGIGGGPRVRVFSGAALPKFTPIADFFAFEPDLRNGVYVGAGDYNLDGKADIAVGAGPGGAPRVRIFNAANAVLQDPNQPVVFQDFFAFDPDLRDGVHVTLRDIDGDGVADIVVGTGGGFPKIRTFISSSSSAPGGPQIAQEITPFDTLTGNNGAWVG